MKLKINHIEKTRTPHFTPNIVIDCTITINLESLMDNSLIGTDLYVEEIGKIFATEFLLQLQENMKNG